MRFVVAALAAFLVLMLDFDGSASQLTTEISPERSSHDPKFEVVASAVPSSITNLFETAEAGEEPNAVPDEAKPETSAKPKAEANTEPKAEANTGETEPVVEADAEPAPDAFCHALRESAEAAGIPVSFFARLIWQESRFRSDEVSHAGAQGVAQFMPETAADVGLDDPFDPFQALPASAKLLRKLRDDFGNLGLAAAAYNAGSGRIQKWLAKQSELPGETRAYVRIITGTKAEAWVDDDVRMLAIRADLPREAPCEGIGGLSKDKDRAIVPASLTPTMTAIVRKAEAAEAAARAAERERQRVAKLSKKHAKSERVARSGKGHHEGHHVAARGSGKGTKPRAIRVASGEGSSS